MFWGPLVRDVGADLDQRTPVHANNTSTVDTKPWRTSRPVLEVGTLPQIKFLRSGGWGQDSMQKGRGDNWACRATEQLRSDRKVTKPVADLCLVAMVGSNRRTLRDSSASRSPSPVATGSSLPPSPKVERFWGVARIRSKNVPVASRSTSADLLWISAARSRRLSSSRASLASYQGIASTSS